MKEQIFKTKGLSLFLVCLLLALINTSFKKPVTSSHAPLRHAQVDTPKKNEVYIDIDLNKVLHQINIELDRINWDNISKDVEISLEAIDIEKIKQDVAQSFRSIDWEKVKSNVNTSLKGIDIDEININIGKAADQIKINLRTEELKKDLKNLKIDTTKIKKEIKKTKQQLNKNKDEIMRNMDRLNDETGNETEGIDADKITHLANTPFPEKDGFFFLI